MKDVAKKGGLVLPEREDLVDLPAALDGSLGTNRADPQKGGKQIDADNDLDAIKEWLDATCTNAHTRRSYRREAYRLLIWAIYFRKKPISSLRVADLRAFEEWLSKPVRHDDWPTEWNVINGPLAESSRVQSLTILKGMFNWLAASQYLAGNPFVLLKIKASRKQEKSRSKLPPTRFFEADLWKWLTGFLDRLLSIEWPLDEKGALLSLPDVLQPDGTYSYWGPDKWTVDRYERLRFITHFLYGSCVRRAELAGGTMGQIAQMNKVWYWNVFGKGGTHMPVVLDDDAMAALRRYRTHRNLAPSPQHGEDAIPIVAKLDRNEPMTDWMLYRELKSFFKHAEMYLRHVEPDHEEWLGKLKHGSTHWLRHTWASHAAASGVPMRVTADQLRHATTATTETVYVHLTLENRQEEMNKVRERLK